MSPEAEALSQALGKSLYGYPNAPATEQDIARVVVEQLGITKASTVASMCSLEAQANARKLRTLLELAGAKE